MAGGDAELTSVGAAVAVAGRYGVAATEPVVLREGAATLVWLKPAPVMAKVAMQPLRRDAGPLLLQEVRVARWLGRSGAPVAVPSPELPRRVHLEERFALTFWRHYPVVDDVDPDRAARALADVHAALASCPVELRSFRDSHLALAGRMLALGGAASPVPAVEVPFLRAAHTALTAELAVRTLFEVPVHGNPHFGHLLVGEGGGYVWAGFDHACRGPVEWDLTILPGGGEGVFAGVDRGLLRLLQDARDLVTAVWCWQYMRPSPLRERVLRERLGRLRRSRD
jgi:hypothetical protein